VRRLLLAHEFSPDEGRGGCRFTWRKHGSCYVPRINAIFIGQLNMVHAGEEAATL